MLGEVVRWALCGQLVLSRVIGMSGRLACLGMQWSGWITLDVRTRSPKRK